ncbi:TRAF-type zinc finger protein (macronuclear) [Tetrahymena thermophila SB210]|uniref:TRAF-type zinc finger protein n=1 Tax=Tetrahymena thermophila (strain SB210) TaxID=312017 RepID=Q23FD5_TETTS|nr:TRAF-type zinc finger protein [Tetrahymena thermophila SB210]EAR95218.1 TRAF-type zinc finger protein [Tetrahymena thermophila SB210]|eukprot:XP_001015463.1 TRAF-type zinc finger protein [Tetrahymena thermophila SB210]
MFGPIRQISNEKKQQQEQPCNKLLQSRFINGPQDIKDDLICLICDNLLLNTSICCQCDQTYCTQCIDEWIKQGSGCLKCEGFQFRRQKPPMYDDFINLITIDCPFSQNPQNFASCSEKGMKLDQSLEHIKNCEFQIKQCPNEGCKLQIEANKYEDHVQQCLYRMYCCPYCNQQMPYLNSQQHDSICPRKQVKCKQCFNFYYQNQINDHEQNDCPQKIMDCQYCNQQFIKNVFQLHQKNCPKVPVNCDCNKIFIREQIDEHKKTCLFVKLICEKCSQQYTRQEDHQNKDCIKYLSLKCQQIETDVYLLNEQINEIKIHLNMPLYKQQSQYQSMIRPAIFQQRNQFF